MTNLELINQLELRCSELEKKVAALDSGFCSLKLEVETLKNDLAIVKENTTVILVINEKQTEQLIKISDTLLINGVENKKKELESKIETKRWFEGFLTNLFSQNGLIYVLIITTLIPIIMKLFGIG